MPQACAKTRDNRERRYFIGGSDARIIMGGDQDALLRLWREKRGELEPEDLSDNLVVQLGLVCEALTMASRGERSVIDCRSTPILTLVLSLSRSLQKDWDGSVP
jgi:predicted phage-related endonuclease